MAKPCILVIHNRYEQPGGEDIVVRAEIELLRHHGHRVLQYARDNREIAGFGVLKKASLAASPTWNQESFSQVRQLIRQERPTVVHCHNLQPLISPSVYYACAAEGVPVVQTAHNYRLACPGGDFFRSGQVCEQPSGACGVRRGCYRGSRAQSAAVSLSLAAHRALGTWQNRVDTYIAPSQFCRQVLCRHGLPSAKVTVKPHFVQQIFAPVSTPGRYAVFVGRLSAEKGIVELLQLWRSLSAIPLLIIGSGPLDSQAKRLASLCPGGQIEFAGQLSHDETIERIRQARFLVAPSLCYETFGLAVLEAAACGVPAIVSRHGALAELVSQHCTGLLLDWKDTEECRDLLRWAWSHPLSMREMGRAARRKARENFSPDLNYSQLMQIYDGAMEERQASGAIAVSQWGREEIQVPPLAAPIRN